MFQNSALNMLTFSAFVKSEASKKIMMCLMLEHEIIPRTSKFNIFFRKIYSNDEIRNQKFHKKKRQNNSIK